VKQEVIGNAAPKRGSLRSALGAALIIFGCLDLHAAAPANTSRTLSGLAGDRCGGRSGKAG